MDTFHVALVLLEEGVALTMIVFGIHQLLNPDAWLEYMPPFIRGMLGIASSSLMRIHALGNILLGLWLASTLALWWSALLALIWWISILPFAFRKNWTIGMRDLTITICIAALLLLESI